MILYLVLKLHIFRYLGIELQELNDRNKDTHEEIILLAAKLWLRLSIQIYTESSNSH